MQPLPSVNSSAPTWDAEFFYSTHDELYNRASSSSQSSPEVPCESSSVSDVRSETLILEQVPVEIESFSLVVSIRKSSRETRRLA